jgi:hypothetical protein
MKPLKALGALIAVGTASKRNSVSGHEIIPKMRARLGLAMLALLCTTSVGAATIKTVVNADPPMCAQLLQMVKDARVPEMTDAQLCDFRFSRLPTSMTRGFTFPRWQEMAVADGSAMYLRMIAANRPPHSVATLPNYVLAKNAAEQAVRDKNLAFYTATVAVSGLALDKTTMVSRPVNTRDLTFVSMELRRCSKLQDVLPSPFYAFFEHSDLRTPISTSVYMAGDQIAEWKGKILVRLNVSYHWVKIGTALPEIVVDLENLWMSSGGGRRFDAGLTGGTRCSLIIDQ